MDDELLDPELLADTAAAFGMLGATSRLQIVWLLAAGPRDVGTLATALGQPVAAVSQHLAKLKLAGLVRARREGRHQIYVIDDPGVVETVRSVVAAQRERRRPDTGRARAAREQAGTPPGTARSCGAAVGPDGLAHRGE